MKRALRIALSCQQDLGGSPHPVPAYRFWRNYFADALAEGGHELLEVPDCDWSAGLLPLSTDALRVWRETTWETALTYIRREHAHRPVDIFLSYLYPCQVHRGALAELRDLGIPSVNFFCDNVREFRRIPEVFRCFDLHWVPEWKALPIYRQDHLAAIHAPMPCWVPPRWRTSADFETLPPTFIGTRDEQRERLFAEAISRGLTLDLRGHGWKSLPTISATPPPRAKSFQELVNRQLAFGKQHGVVALARKTWNGFRHAPRLSFDFSPYAKSSPSGEAYWSMLRESSVCLGVNRYPTPRRASDRPDTYSRLRDIEAPMAGACYLTEWTEGLDHLYDLGREIETYRTPDELVEKTQMLVADAGQRSRLRLGGQRRSLSEHTILRTISKIAVRFGLPA